MNHHLRQRNSLERFPGDLVPFPSNTVSSPPTPSRGRTTLLACPPFSRFSLSRGLLSAVFQGSCHWQPPGNNKIPSTAQERRHKLGRCNERTHRLAGMKVQCHAFIFSSYWGCARGECSPSHCYSMDMAKLEINILELKLHSQENELTAMCCGSCPTPFTNPGHSLHGTHSSLHNY